MKKNLFSLVLVFSAVFLYFGLLALIPQANGHLPTQLSNSPSLRADSSQSEPANTAITHASYLPIIFGPPLELYGYVTENGEPARDVTVQLVADYLMWPVPPYSKLLGTTTTDERGLYNFTGVPSISCTSYPPCWKYYIWYTDPTTNTGRLAYWRTEPITNYIQGTIQNFATFDIAAPVYVFPVQGDIVSPTVTFTWLARENIEDDYGITIGWNETVGWSTKQLADHLGHVSSYTAVLEGNCSDDPEYYYYPCSNFYNRPLIWWLNIGECCYYGASGGAYSSGVFTITVP